MARNHQTLPYKYFDCTHKLPIIYQSSTEDCTIRILILKCTYKWHENQSAPRLFSCTKELPTIYWSYTEDWTVRIFILDCTNIMEFPSPWVQLVFFYSLQCTALWIRWKKGSSVVNFEKSFLDHLSTKIYSILRDEV